MRFLKYAGRLALVAGLVAPAACTGGPIAGQTAVAVETPYVAAKDLVAAGEYITTLGGCNDCHTPGWMETNGKVPVADRLTGAPIGFLGPWGTTYPANLRLSVQSQTAPQWIAMIRARTGNPPMPWMNLHGMSDRDLRAVYEFLRALGPKGVPAPAYLPPGRMPATPYFDFTPKNLPQG